MDQITKDRIIQVLIEDSLDLNHYHIRTDEVTTLVNLIQSKPTEVVVYSDGMLQISETYRINIQGELILDDNTSTRDYIEFPPSDTLNSLVELIDSANSLESIQIALNLPVARILGEKLYHVSPEYKETLHGVLRAIEPMLKYCTTLTRIDVSRFDKLDRDEEVQSAALDVLREFIKS